MPTKQYKKTDKQFQSKEGGKIIKSQRLFGIELEVFSPSIDAYKKLMSSLADSFGFHHDGSLRGDGLPVEIVTPPLSGLAGEKAVISTTEKMNKLGYQHNDTCGLHVHLDGEEFQDKEEFEVLPITSSLGFAVEHVYDDKLFKILSQYISPADFYKVIMTNSERTKETVGGVIMRKYMVVLPVGTIPIYEANGRFFSISGEDRKKIDSIQSKLDELRVKNPEKSYPTVFGVGDLPLKDRRDILKLRSDRVDAMNLTKLIRQKPTDLCIHVSSKSGFTKTRTLMYAYTIFSDVFLSIIPHDRRENTRYCQKLIQRIAPFEIENTKCYSDLETLWFKVTDKSSIDKKKGHRYDESRYYGVNFHSLFGKNKTVEIRWHEMTLDPRQILYWTAFHQHILDMISSGGVTLDNLRGGFDYFYVSDRIDFFFELFKFPKEIEEYMKHRIEFYSKSDKK